MSFILWLHVWKPLLWPLPTVFSACISSTALVAMVQSDRPAKSFLDLKIHISMPVTCCSLILSAWNTYSSFRPQFKGQIPTEASLIFSPPENCLPPWKILVCTKGHQPWEDPFLSFLLLFPTPQFLHIIPALHLSGLLCKAAPPAYKLQERASHFVNLYDPDTS